MAFLGGLIAFCNISIILKYINRKKFEKNELSVTNHLTIQSFMELKQEVEYLKRHLNIDDIKKSA